MITIKKTGEGYYLVSMTSQKEEWGRTDCYILKKEIMVIVKPHREITISVKGIKAINNGGINILLELKNIADRNNCKLRFINVEPQLVKKISGLTERKIQPQKKAEI